MGDVMTPKGSLKKLKWKSASGISAKVSDRMARVPGHHPSYYSVYQGTADLSKFYWYNECGKFQADVHDCSSIEDGIKQAEIHYKEKYK